MKSIKNFYLKMNFFTSNNTNNCYKSLILDSLNFFLNLIKLLFLNKNY